MRFKICDCNLSYFKLFQVDHRDGLAEPDHPANYAARSAADSVSVCEWTGGLTKFDIRNQQ